MHYSWMEGSLDAMEETYLHHKLEAMRLVNEQIGDPVLSTSDGCINTITALALTEVRDTRPGLVSHTFASFISIGIRR